MMDPHSHNTQMQYYNQQNDFAAKYECSSYSPWSRALPSSTLPSSNSLHPPRSHSPQMRYYKQQSEYAHHMMQMAQVAQAPRRGRKPLNEKKKRRKRNRPGSHIKRAKTAYFFFLDDFRKSYCKDGDQIPKVKYRASEITKACGKQWGIMTELDKKPYADKAAEDRKRYESEISVYRKVRDPDKPKKPPTAYFYFLTDFRAQMAGQKIEKGRRLTEICGEEWNKLTEEQKKPYLDRVAIEYKKYQERMEEYRRKKGMAQPPQTQMRAQQRAQPIPQEMPTQIPTQIPSQIPSQIPMSYNGKSSIAMPVPHDEEEDEDEIDDEEEDEEDDV
ncbi:uncharacterized protein [Amphiura filiformis]|uniref:uncharacterized protein isoform X3 n=1 Tax=Amphiura filiformis TaxID=82378 RepID=UPI003B226867